jgi:hypothetical protein
VAPASGRFACVSFWLEGLPEECDLNGLEVRIERAPGEASYIGPPLWDGVSQINVALPPGTRTGLVTAEMDWLGAPLSPPSWIRVIPPAPPVPRLYSVCDAINLVSGARIRSRLVKLTLEEITAPEKLTASVDGIGVERLEWFEIDASTARFEVNFRLPDAVGPGAHQIRIGMGRQTMPPVPIEVV